MALNFVKTNTFASGTVISSSAVNTNFDEIANVFTGLEALTSTFSNLGVDTILKSAGTIQSANGTVALPGLTFTNDLDCGWYRIGANNIAVATNGTKALEISATQQILGIPGSAALPAFGYSADPNTGLYNSSADQITVTCGGTGIASFNSSGVSMGTGQFIALTAAAGGYVFSGDADTGMYSATTDTVEFQTGGTRRFFANSTRFAVTVDSIPNTDNALNCGGNASRWVAVYAVNGTIQTSHSDTKTNISDVEHEKVIVPRAVKFGRPDDKHDKLQIGFLADNLPEECFAVDENGVRSTENVYTSAVVGLLCAAVTQLQADVEALKA